MPKSISNKQFISQLLDSEKLIQKSDLTRLSMLDDDEHEYFEQKWSRADIDRRRKIITYLMELSQEYNRLDFTRIFVFCLEDDDAKVRIKAISGLVEEEDPRLIKKLVQLLLKDRSDDVRSTSAVALGRLAMQGELGKITSSQTEEVYRALMEVIDNRSETANVRASVLEAIAPLNMPRIKGLIEEAYHSDNPEIKISSIRAMGLNCNRMWLTALIKELKNSDDRMRLAAVQACAELGEEDVVLDLMELVEDENPQIQIATIKALGEIGGDEARQILTMLTTNPQQKIRKAAELALRELEFCEDPLSLNF